jgi:NitT/TauT family transport system permease protein
VGWCRSRPTGWVDLAVIAGLLAAFIYALVTVAREWSGPLQPVPEIHLEARYLPLYTLFSLSRGVIAYGVSFLFTMVYGYAMARVAGAERVMLPVLDILQSIPVLGFLPGFVLGLVHLFPHQNIGLEIASVLMIFTGQVWNMTFSFYSSLKSVPPDLVAVARLARMSWWERFFRLDLSFAATGLLWNSMMSMAGGWFFLMVSEAFVLGEHDFRLPGLGSYMSLAIERGDGRAQLLGVLAMLGMIVFVDQVVWRPLVAWSHKFTDEETTAASGLVALGADSPVADLAGGVAVVEFLATAGPFSGGRTRDSRRSAGALRGERAALDQAAARGRHRRGASCSAR